MIDTAAAECVYHHHWSASSNQNQSYCLEIVTDHQQHRYLNSQWTQSWPLETRRSIPMVNAHPLAQEQQLDGRTDHNTKMN